MRGLIYNTITPKNYEAEYCKSIVYETQTMLNIIISISRALAKSLFCQLWSPTSAREDAIMSAAAD